MNVILLISDTVRHDYCGCYGADWVRTPNIDALARESTLMENFFTASFPTGPMRKDTYSGRFTFPYCSWQTPRGKEEILLHDVLRDAGVKTAFIGDATNSAQFRDGFDEIQLIPALASNIKDVPESVPEPAAPEKLRGGGTPRMQRIMRNYLGFDGEADRRAPRTMRAAHHWLEDQHGSERPFFLWVDTFDPHEPYDCPRYYIDLYDKGYKGDELIEPTYAPSDYATGAEIQHMRKMYAAKLTMVDRWIGHFLDGVRNMGRLEDTAVIFTSDHGFYHGEHGLIGKLLLEPERERWPLYDTIAHPPLLIRPPGAPRPARRDGFCQPPDLMPTILDFFGLAAPDRVQGKSLLPIVHGDVGSVRDFAVSSTTYVTDETVRSPTCFRTKEYLYVYGGDEWDHELFDLRADPEEAKNIFSERTDVAAEMHKRYVEFLESVDCPKAFLELRREFNAPRRAVAPGGRVI